ncbi:MAG: UvrD-helicase domain-containing protein [Candidatus Peribacteria bacterium]|nr:MAG: UvrD-helicase domain-containing protein [Candidatus Peribacteria bacterium]
MVVGDDDQSIYRFQGANIENMLDFSVAYPNTKFIVLKQNYRSTQGVLDLAHTLIENNTERLSNSINSIQKELVASGKYA